jgi:hypothetical protein
MEKAQMGPKMYLIIFGLLFLAIGGVLVASALGLISFLPITLPETIMDFPALYIFGGIVGLGVILLLASFTQMY